MENSLSDFDRILFTDLRPAQQKNRKPDYYKQLMAQLLKEPLEFKVTWKAEFMFAINPMTKYYAMFIDNQCNRYYNHICSEMMLAAQASEKTFIITMALCKTLALKLKETAREILTVRADPEVLKGNNAWQEEKGNDWENVFILYYLKTKLTALYLNIQDRYPELLNDDSLTAAQLELTYFRGVPSGPGIIRLAEAGEQPLEPAKVIAATAAPLPEIPVNPKVQDTHRFNPIVKQVQFDEIINRLKEYDILDAHGYFVENKKEGHKRLLSAVYKAMISAGFFRKTDPVTRRKLKETDIRKYLDDHFKVDLKETFRKITPAQMEQSKIKLPWLERVR